MIFLFKSIGGEQNNKDKRSICYFCSYGEKSYASFWNKL